MRNSKLFKMGSFEEELAKGMEQKMIRAQDPRQSALEKLAKAINCLNTASEIFDGNGMFAEAEVLTRMLERISISGMKKAEKSPWDPWDQLSKEEQAFYHGLPGHVKRQLKSGDGPTLRTDAPGLDYNDFIANIQNLYAEHKARKQHQEKLPEIVEFESLFPKEMPDAAAAPGGDIIEFDPIMMPETGEYEVLPPSSRRGPPPLPRTAKKKAL